MSISRLPLSAGFIMCLVLMLLLFALWIKPNENAHLNLIAEDNAVVSSRAEDLKTTIVSADLQAPITSGKNVIWCATIQIAWNELCTWAGGSVHLVNEPQLVAILNQKVVVREDFDTSSLFADAGIIKHGAVERIRSAIETKFPDDPYAALPTGSSQLPGNAWIVYAYLAKTLPFEWAFKRLEEPLTFNGTEVEAFGITQYLNIQKDEVKAAQQVTIHDYNSPDDFIIELSTQSKQDRLILAKVSPRSTLCETISMVEQRLEHSTHRTSLPIGADLVIPLIDYNLVQEYSDLYGKSIVTENLDIKDSEIGLALQQIRFRLDERGAILKSKAIFAESMAENVVFDKPFLLVVQSRRSGEPYLAMWVATPEILVPVSKRGY